MACLQKQPPAVLAIFADFLDYEDFGHLVQTGKTIRLYLEPTRLVLASSLQLLNIYMREALSRMQRKAIQYADDDCTQEELEDFVDDVIKTLTDNPWVFRSSTGVKNIYKVDLRELAAPVLSLIVAFREIQEASDDCSRNLYRVVEDTMVQIHRDPLYFLSARDAPTWGIEKDLMNMVRKVSVAGDDRAAVAVPPMIPLVADAAVLPAAAIPLEVAHEAVSDSLPPAGIVLLHQVKIAGVFGYGLTTETECEASPIMYQNGEFNRTFTWLHELHIENRVTKFQTLQPIAGSGYSQLIRPLQSTAALKRCPPKDENAAAYLGIFEAMANHVIWGADFHRLMHTVELHHGIVAAPSLAQRLLNLKDHLYICTWSAKTIQEKCQFHQKWSRSAWPTEGRMKISGSRLFNDS